jgi:hypothetical protein
MMLSNDAADRWVNGSLGRVTAIGRDDDGLRVDVELRDGATVDVRPNTWEATRPVIEDGTLRREVVGTYTQLPLKLAWTITIHKSQGQTLDRLVVDLRGGAFDYGQVYVALSRCTSLAGLVLTRDVLPKDLRTDRRIVRFLRAATAPGAAARHCAVSILTVGQPGRMSQPRPVELAVAFDDGTSISTLINPQRDLDDARTAYGIAVEDVLLAPTLAEAWSVIAPLVDGCTPVGVEVDQDLFLIDFELKRLGAVARLPVGAEIPAVALTPDDRTALRARTAAARARATLDVLAREHLDTAEGSPFDLDAVLQEDGQDDLAYLLTRDPGARTPSSAALPTLSALMRTSTVLSDVLLGATTAGAVAITPDPTVGAVVRDVVQERVLAAAARTTGLPPTLIDRLLRLEQVLGIAVVDTILDDATSAGCGIDDALHPGARVCFTGTAVDDAGQVWDRERMKAAAAAHGLVPVDSVTKSRCDALVVAEVGTQSGKARKAKELEKPVLSAAEFFGWLAER